jgi:hypothetical protein
MFDGNLPFKSGGAQNEALWSDGVRRRRHFDLFSYSVLLGPVVALNLTKSSKSFYRENRVKLAIKKL